MSDQSAEPMTVRRWMSGKPADRLSREHWKDARDTHINADLSGFQTTIRMRATYEIANNPILEGIVRTHQTDVVGANGPLLQVMSSDKAYNEAFEAGWRQWWEMPDAQGIRAGVDVLRQWVMALWARGDGIEQKIYDSEASGPVKMRLLPIHSRRLMTPIALAGEKDIVLGIRVNRLGRPVEYFLAHETRFGDYDWIDPTGFDRIPSRDMVHIFVTDEPDQVRGVPLAASALPVIAELRDYDVQVLDAARAAASWAVYLVSQFPNADPVQLTGGDEMEIRRRMLSVAPPGWKPEQVTPEQPSTRYVEYRRERMAEMGRPVGMPLMMIRLDSGDHNYSSARFDNQIYARSNNVFRGFLERRGLNQLAWDVERELQLGGLLRRRPKDARIAWRWEPMPHVDRSKEALADRMQLSNFTLPWSYLLANEGLDPETVWAAIDRDRAEFERRGLPYPGMIDWQQIIKAAMTEPSGGGTGNGGRDEGTQTSKGTKK